MNRDFKVWNKLRDRRGEEKLIVVNKRREKRPEISKLRRVLGRLKPRPGMPVAELRVMDDEVTLRNTNNFNDPLSVRSHATIAGSPPPTQPPLLKLRTQPLNSGYR